MTHTRCQLVVTLDICQEHNGMGIVLFPCITRQDVFDAFLPRTAARSIVCAAWSRDVELPKLQMQAVQRLCRRHARCGNCACWSSHYAMSGVPSPPAHGLALASRSIAAYNSTRAWYVLCWGYKPGLAEQNILMRTIKHAGQFPVRAGRPH